MAGGQLPEDLVRDILLRLPVKSLMRFRCVCKLWYDLIKSPNFVELHLKNSSASIRRKIDHVIVIKCFLQPDDNNSIVISFMSAGTDIVVDMDIPFPKGDESIFFLGTCNGLVCITNHYETVLCNPATRQFKALAINSPSAYPDDYVHWPHCVGFGFDPDISDYKVVRIVCLMHKYEDFSNEDGYRVEVYNLSSNSCREIDAVLPSSSIFILHSPCVAPLFNEAFHWLVRKDSKDEYILSFQISNEVFELIPFPDTLSYPDGHSRSLTILKESLALIHYGNLESRPDVVGNYFDIWVMNEYGVKESWTRLLRIGPLLGIDFPLAFWNNDEELLVETSDRQLVSYNLHDLKEFKRFQVHGVPLTRVCNLPTLGVVIYSESLVSIDGANESENST